MSERTDQRTYELTLWVSPSISESETESVVREIWENVRHAGGSILYRSGFVTRRLEYPIRNAASGYFGMLRFSGGNAILEGLRDVLRHEPKILRHLVTRLPREEQELLSAAAARPPRQRLRSDAAPPQLSSEKTPSEKVKIEELNQKLEEILGRDAAE